MTIFPSVVSSATRGDAPWAEATPALSISAAPNSSVLVFIGLLADGSGDDAGPGEQLSREGELVGGRTVAGLQPGGPLVGIGAHLQVDVAEVFLRRPVIGPDAERRFEQRARAVQLALRR